MADASAAPAAAPAASAAPAPAAADALSEMNYALVKHSDMKEELRVEATESEACLKLLQVVVAACEKYPGKFDVAAKMIKETMDKKFAPNWHCIMGGSLGFEVVCEKHSLLYMYYGGNCAILLFKY